MRAEGALPHKQRYREGSERELEKSNLRKVFIQQTVTIGFSFRKLLATCGKTE